MQKNPLVSIIIPAFNAENFLKDAVESCLAQTYKNIEIIVIDDGSTDKTSSILEAYKDVPRIVLIKNPQNSGLIFTLNRGMELAKGDLIARMDADDISLPNRIEKQVNFLLENPTIDIIGSDVILIDEHGKKHGRPREQLSSEAQIEWSIITSCPLHHPTVMLRHKVEYLSSEKYVEDLGLWTRKILEGEKIHVLQSPLLLYRKHSGSITHNYSKAQIQAVTSIAKKYSIQKWDINISESLIYSLRSSSNFDQDNIFQDLDQLLKDLRTKCSSAIYVAAITNLQIILLNYLHTIFFKREETSFKAFKNITLFLISRRSLPYLLISIYKYYHGLFRRLVNTRA